MSIGVTALSLPVLQYADDAIFMGEWETSNAENLVKFLRCFEAVSGLQVNLQKSKIIGVGVPSSEVQRTAYRLHCQADVVPFIYLGLPVGANMNRRASWSGVVDKVSKKLNAWKANTLSMGGRLTLVKSVLNSIPLYFFSIFKAPVSVLSELEKFRNKFLWGAVGSTNKIIWAKSSKTWGDFDVGGLKVGSLKAKNLALLKKWWWRFRTNRDCQWVHVIQALYGDDGCYGSGGGRLFAGPWRNILAVGNVIDQCGIPFTSGFQQVVGNGAEIKFWTDIWCSGICLKDKFKRLFNLESAPDCVLSSRALFHGEEVEWTWQWRREPRGREEGELNRLMELLQPVSFK